MAGLSSRGILSTYSALGRPKHCPSSVQDLPGGSEDVQLADLTRRDDAPVRRRPWTLSRLLARCPRASDVPRQAELTRLQDTEFQLQAGGSSFGIRTPCRKRSLMGSKGLTVVRQVSSILVSTR